MSIETNKNCVNCPVHNVAHLKKLGVNMNEYDYLVALAGNPNTGKSTVFNALTGLKQHTGNWPGKTVTRAEGGFEYDDLKFKIIDLPGTYSLLSTSKDEEVARNFILFGQPDVTVIVVDATRLERNLNLTLQTLEITDYAVLCLNLMDEAERNNVEVDVRTLSRMLGIPVVPTSARTKEGIDNLLKSIKEVATGEYVCKPRKVKKMDNKYQRAVDVLVKDLNENFPDLKNPRWVAMRLLEGDQSIINALEDGSLNATVEKTISDEKVD